MLDANDAHAHHAMGYVALRRLKFDIAGEHFDRGVSLNPNDVAIAADRANWLLYVGRLGEALEILDSVLKRDPYSPTWIWEIRGVALYHLKRFDEAITALRRVSTDTLPVLLYLAAANAQAGHLDDAQSALASYLHLKPNVTLSEIAPRALFGPGGGMAPVLRDHLLDGLRKAGMPEQEAREVAKALRLKPDFLAVTLGGVTIRYPILCGRELGWFLDRGLLTCRFA